MEKIALIKVKGLSHSFGEGKLKKEILHNISVNFYNREIMIIIGPSGAGKTTFLTLLSALRKIQTGSVSVDGVELNTSDEDAKLDVRRKIGFVFQAHNLFEALTATQNVQMSLINKSEETAESSRKKAIEELTKVGLAEFVNKKPKQLSGGQKQRIAIARALVHSPKIIMADEPTAALDKKTGREVVNLLHKLAKESGCSVLVVTHDNRILDIADRIIKFEDGRMEETDFVIKKMVKEIFKVVAMLPDYWSKTTTNLKDYRKTCVRILDNLDSYITNDIYNGVNEKLRNSVLLIEEMKANLFFIEGNLFQLVKLYNDEQHKMFAEIDPDFKKELDICLRDLLLAYKSSDIKKTEHLLEAITLKVEKIKSTTDDDLLEKSEKVNKEVLEMYNLSSRILYFLLEFIKILVEWQKSPTMESLMTNE